jgi:hypothetical protein
LSGRRRKSKNFGLPRKNLAALPLRTLTPQQRERASETLLVSTLVAMLPWEWQARVDAESAIDLLKAFAPVMPSATIRALEEGVEDLPDDPDDPDDHDRGAAFALLLALTDRLLGLDLPATNEDLFQGPPIVARRLDGLPPRGPVLDDGTGA